MTDAVQVPNHDQAALWNTTAGRTWAELQDLLDRVLGPFVQPVVEAGFPGPGGRVVDIGCGAGATTLAMASKLGSDGLALGVDISAPLVETAKARAADAGLGCAAFIQADAQTYAFEADAFDAVISRFGVMFFDDPEAAFANIRRGVRRDGRLAFVAWRSPAENAFMTTGVRAAAPFLPQMPAPVPDAPGQFGFADGARVRRILEGAGWRDVEVAPLDLPLTIAEPDLMTYVTRMGPAGLALQQADDELRARIVAALEDAFRPFVRDGEARFDTACWQVAARA
jgi:SAM-dependent methyltransferase